MLRRRFFCSASPAKYGGVHQRHRLAARQGQHCGGLQSLIMVESTRGIVERNGTGQSSIERRTYISSLPAKAALPGRTVGAHRGIENSMHGVFDVAFPEDGSQDPGWRDTSEFRRLAPL